MNPDISFHAPGNDESLVMAGLQLEAAIEWRDGQSRALHALRRYLVEIKAHATSGQTNRPLAAARPFMVAGRRGGVVRGDRSRLLWNAVREDGMQVWLYVSFFSESQRSRLEQLLQASTDAAGSNQAELPRETPAMAPGENDAIRLKIRDRIDDFNQLNRDDLERLRLLAMAPFAQHAGPAPSAAIPASRRGLLFGTMRS